MKHPNIEQFRKTIMLLSLTVLWVAGVQLDSSASSTGVYDAGGVRRRLRLESTKDPTGRLKWLSLPPPPWSLRAPPLLSRGPQQSGWISYSGSGLPSVGIPRKNKQKLLVLLRAGTGMGTGHSATYFRRIVSEPIQIRGERK